MVALRVFDLGALIVWLIWFYRQKNDDDGPDDDWRRDDGPEPDEPPAPKGGDGLDLPRPDAVPSRHRRRDHTGDRAPATAPARRSLPRPARPHRVPARHHR